MQKASLISSEVWMPIKSIPVLPWQFDHKMYCRTFYAADIVNLFFFFKILLQQIHNFFYF